MTGSLMGFPQTSNTVVGNTDGGMSYDSKYGSIIGVDSADVTIYGLRKWDAWPNGIELRARNGADLGVVAITSPYTQTFNSNEFVITEGAGNSTALIGYSRFDLTLTSSFGSVSSSLSPSSGLRILYPNKICAWRYSGQDIVSTVSLTASPAEVNSVNWGNKYNYPTTITQTFACIGSVPDGSGTLAYVFGFNANNTAMQLYALGAPGALTSIGTITPGQIDATWTNVNFVFGITVDQTDGNVILLFRTTDAVTNKVYIAKLSVANCALIWAVPVGASAYDNSDMAQNVVKNGTLYYLGGVAGTTLFTINTKTGASTTSTMLTAQLDALHGHQISEDVSGSIMWYGSFSDGGLAPNYLGTYCLTEGNHSGSHMPWRFWPAAVPNPAPAYAAPASSRKRAWFFVLDGHEMYVLDLGPEGTWIFDRSSNEWCQFITSGYVQWNFANGCMWGNRIVAGDLLTTEVWEMQPSMLFDNGATEIIHTVTGGVATRDRVYHSVDMFRLACSSGLYTDTTGAATVTLSFSDDQGNTYVTMDTYTLTEGKFSQEFLWTSLGSFAAPGRIFKITDSGAFLRIDGADAGIDGFDPVTGESGTPGGNVQ